jgi:hypothetical protein
MEVCLRTPFFRGMKLQHSVISQRLFERPFCLYVKGCGGLCVCVCVCVCVCRQLRHKGRLHEVARSDWTRRTSVSRPESGFAKSVEK